MKSPYGDSIVDEFVDGRRDASVLPLFKEFSSSFVEPHVWSSSGVCTLRSLRYNFQIDLRDDFLSEPGSIIKRQFSR